ncbi:hypothetical protein RB619_17570 [Flavobacterium sp. LHD-80]|uniref:hypothetical protein n=1 Tax=Flavobacterium sp. LHD-80 TaxID=3071411 RepID=UPI0027DF19D2|nr:hypothetical protein [Flavobacterium sp. LHD-80]MDQ6472455.1 hypothetical protein [Flavobacterium sp. LHD-80]
MDFLIGPSGLILLGAILSAIGALWASQSQSSFERESKEKSEQLVMKSEEIATLNKEIVKIVTGGDSFCLFDFTGTIHNPLVLRHDGKYPIYELKISIRNLGDYRQISGRSIQILTAQTNTFMAGTINPQYWGLMPTMELDKRLVAQGFRIEYESRGGSWYQEFRFFFIKDKIEYATKVIRNIQDKNEIIYEKKSDNFPLNKRGEIDWYQDE